MAVEQGSLHWLLASLALQNLVRRKSRTLLLIAAVAIGSGGVFTGATLMRSIQSSMTVGFTRMGADLMVVPEGALTNITAALLTVEPTDLTLDSDVLDRANLKGVGRLAPQQIVRTEHSGVGGAHEPIDLIGFEPLRDFTVQPWLAEKLNRDLAQDDVIIGARRDAPLGSQMLVFGKPFTVYGKLAATGVGTHERGLFMSMASLATLGPAIHAQTGSLPSVLQPNKVTGFLVELAGGATELQVRFAILSAVKGVKIIAGDSTLTGIRQGLTALLSGILALMVLMFVSTALMVSVLFSAIITERRNELGLLKAIGARRGQIVGAMLLEAVIATGVGGIVGVVLGVLAMQFYERSLVYYLDNIGVPFIWLEGTVTIAFAVTAIILAAIIGGLGTLYPAWRASRRDAYDLIRGEG
ncbi:putative ABC transport system permease protein [Rhodoligotrophos appendicifer]|uniref:ABC transporter permease n=1 Tax=Rhodoligotrophos appendicifer TaxID=987056 RepID=UPI001186CB09|nr:ABC transporter permease [Rhodoligotrophos appendicifer]